MNNNEINKKLEKKIEERTEEVARKVDDMFRNYNNNIQVDFLGYHTEIGCSNYLFFKQIIEDISNYKEFNQFKKQLSNWLIELEKKENELNTRLNKKLTFLNGYDPEKYEYNQEADLFVRIEEFKEFETFEEFEEVFKEQEKEEEEEILVEVDQKVTNLFLN